MLPEKHENKQWEETVVAVWPDGKTNFQYLAIYMDVNLPNSIKYLPK